MIPMSWYLIFSAALFCIGLYGVLSRKNSVAILMGVELMLNSANINLLTFWHYYSQIRHEPQMGGLVFTAIVFAVAAAETAVGLALIISAYRRRQNIIASDLTELKG
ncbi:NADH dehydrogenase subunit K [Longilinea arvoryzae]|uniref:NADH-quinone oxidoreductase subunit K n=1 Tax=Longilinea arvoryzae TaxID=360412 RepID=A0A0S7BBR5_9CHLR|nr:NADH-quinone oxidoreductase subunit NuoK [Longilinea arvoryzae]GAP15279.1 NADH dehydrogenase subunit K [Longilinea arvoryzae]